MRRARFPGEMVKTYLQYYRSLCGGALWGVILLALAALAFGWLGLHGLGEDWAVAIQERLDAGKNPTLVDYMQAGFLWSSLFLSGVGLILLLSAPVWLRPLPAGFGADLAEKAPDGGRLYVLGLVGAVLAGALLFGVRMDLSIYNDEDHTLRKYVRGEFERPPGDLLAPPVFEPLSWPETLFSVGDAPNQVLFCASARGCLWVYQKIRGTDQRDVGEWPFRLPSYLAGLGLILALGVLGRQVHSPRAGVLAAWLAAFHPWIVRYSSEGRGYALALLFVVLSWNFLLPALGSGRWRWWLAYGGAQFAALYAYLGAVYVPVVQNLLVLGALGVLALRNRQFPAVNLVLRWAIANTLSVSLLLLALAPALPQLLDYMRSDLATGTTSPDYLRDFWTFLALGMPWSGVAPSMQAFDEPLWLIFVVGILVPALVVLGGLTLLRKNWGVALLALTAVLAPCAGYFHNILGGRLLYIWYLIWTTPFIVLFAASGIANCSDWLGKRSKFLGQGSTVAVFLGAVMIGAQLPALGVYLERSKQGLKPAVQAMHRPVDPTGATASPVLSIACWVSVPHYDPHCSVIYHRAIIENAIALAEAQQRPLYAAYGMRSLIAHYQPDVLALLEDPAVFEPVAVIPGLEELNYAVYVVKYSPSSHLGENQGGNQGQHEERQETKAPDQF